MRAGLLRNRVRIEEATDTRDSGGGMVRVWQLLDVVPAEITSVDGGEPVDGDSLTSTIQHTVKIRYRTGVTASMRLYFRERAFRILSIVDPDSRKRELVLTCVEKVDDEVA